VALAKELAGISDPSARMELEDVLRDAVRVALDNEIREQSTPFHAPFDVQTRIEELQGYLDPKSPHCEREEQHANIKAVIKLCQDRKIDGVT
jgi:hypothetical protein